MSNEQPKTATVYTRDGHIRTYELRDLPREGQDPEGCDGLGMDPETDTFVIRGWIHDYEETSQETDSGPIISRHTTREVRVEAHFLPANISFYELTI